jgi:hypothetical protein
MNPNPAENDGGDRVRQFVCMKWGTLYGADYVNRLHAMVRRRCGGEIRFVCLTDDSEGIDSRVECHPCPEVAIPDPYRNRGWRKLSLFAAHLDGMQGDWLYLDLDVVIVGDLDPFFAYEPQRAFVVMQNWTQPGKGIGNTSVYRFRIGENTYLLEDLETESARILSRYRNSQTYVSRHVHDLHFWPDEWCVLFKTHCVPPWPQRFWRRPGLPPTARVVAFPGVPNPHQAAIGEWPAKAYKKVYKSIRPARWVLEHWRI